MANIAYRVDLITRDDPSFLKRVNGHTWEADDQFSYAGNTWTVEAVIQKYRDGVPYPSLVKCILIAECNERKASVIVDAREVELLESEKC
jgi:hypothetical protein